MSCIHQASSPVAAHESWLILIKVSLTFWPHGRLCTPTADVWATSFLSFQNPFKSTTAHPLGLFYELPDLILSTAGSIPNPSGQTFILSSPRLLHQLCWDGDEHHNVEQRHIRHCSFWLCRQRRTQTHPHKRLQFRGSGVREPMFRSHIKWPAIKWLVWWQHLHIE